VRIRWPWPIGLAAIAGAVLAIRSLWAPYNPTEEYGLAANRYNEYAEAYRDWGKSNGDRLTLCYGGRWDGYTQHVYKDLREHKDDEAYRRAKSSHFESLGKKYQEAAAHPEKPVTLDPPLTP
jgi:hypothetical protein